MSKITKTIYVILFVALLVMPHLSDHVKNISRAYVESIVMLVIFGIAYLTYFLSNNELRKHKEQKSKIEHNLEISEQKLLDSFKYLGTVNRRLTLLKDLSSDFLNKKQFTKKYKKSILNNLLTVANFYRQNKTRCV